MVENSPYTRIDQIGVVVRDLEKSIKYYESLGIGPFATPKGVAAIKRWIHGKPVDPASVKFRTVCAMIGPVEFELLEPGGGNTLWQKFLDTRGEGINHLGFFVPDIEKATAITESMGFTAVYASRFQGGGGAAYFDTDRVGGVMFELIQRAKV